jgi:hypothetical protein
MFLHASNGQETFLILINILLSAHVIQKSTWPLTKQLVQASTCALCINLPLQMVNVLGSLSSSFDTFLAN